MKSGRYNVRNRRSFDMGSGYLDTYLGLYSQESVKVNWKERAFMFITITTFIFGVMFASKLFIELTWFLMDR